MFFHCFKAALRSLLRRKGQSAISILGLAVGLTCSIMIFVWVSGELSYESFHTNGDRVYQLIHDRGQLTPTALAPHMKESYPEIDNAARVHQRLWQVAYGEESGNYRIHCVDPSFLDMFSFELVAGDPEQALVAVESIIISESMAERLFGVDDPIGETVSIEKSQDLIVTGVMKNVPFNSHLQFDGLVNVRFLNVIFSWFHPMDSWTDGDMWTYCQTSPGADIEALTAKIQQVVAEREPESKVYLEPIKDIHLYRAGGGSPRIVYVYLFIGAAILILLSACINYVNLATARASDRAREVGIRKVAGAKRFNLIWQFMGETVVVALVAASLAFSLVETLRNPFEALTGRSAPEGLLSDPIVLIGVIGIVALAGIVAGVYPSIVLSSFRPAKVLRTSTGNRSGGSLFRRVLVVGQFAVSVVLIIGAIVVYSQMQYIKDKDLGYNRDAILHLPLQSDIWTKIEPIMADLDANPNVLNYTFTNTLLNYQETSTDRVTWEGQNTGDELYVRVQTAGYSFAEVFGIEMVEGRFFSRDFSTDLEGGYIVNEAAVAAMNMSSPIGKQFSLMGQAGTIVGVVKDYNYRSLHYDIQPLVLCMRPNWSDNLAIRAAPTDIVATAAAIQGSLDRHVLDYPEKVRFFDDELDALYRSETRMARMFAFAAGLAVFMSCLGLIGLVSYAVRRRAREIGIRKVMGASVNGIVRLITREYVFAVLTACLIAWPLALWASSRWLDTFAFAIPLSWKFFAMAGALTMLVALVTAGIYALRSAQADPGDALRCE